MTRQVSPKVRDALDETGLPWEIRNGSKHRKLVVDGHTVAVMSHGGHSRAMKSECYGDKTLVSAIRKFAATKSLQRRAS